MSNNFDIEQTYCVVCGSRDGETEACGIDYIYEGSSQICTAKRCSGCGHIYLNPRPTRNAIDTLYPSNYASFSRKFTDGNTVLGRLKEFIQMRRINGLLRALPKGARYLDVGCGDGQLLMAVKRRFPNLEVHGLDWKFEPLVRSQLEALNIFVHESLLEDIVLKPSYFHLITMNQLIEHLWDPRKCLLMIRQILSPFGHLILATPNTQGYDRHFFIKGLWGGYYFPRHLNLFNESQLIRMLDECGLETIQSRSLVAPIIWCYSIKAFMKTRLPSANWVHRLIDVNNLLLMSIFTALDLIAILFRMTTSNQEIIVRPCHEGVTKIHLDI
jgi:2-polyprenyl-3-methyl-5-hydroxy-6-metoxy-1,4-benzoquinol methylase